MAMPRGTVRVVLSLEGVILPPQILRQVCQLHALATFWPLSLKGACASSTWWKSLPTICTFLIHCT